MYVCVCVLQALGRALLRSLEGGQYSRGGFVTCLQLSTPKGYLIITRVHVLAVHLPHLATSRWTPTLVWALALGDLQHCKARGDSKHTLALLVMQPEMTLLESQQRLAQKALGLRPIARSPWCLRTASFQVTWTACSVQVCLQPVTGKQHATGMMATIGNNLLYALRIRCCDAFFVIAGDMTRHMWAVYLKSLISC